MSDKSGWTPDKEKALKSLIRATIEAAGPIDPAAIPHLVKEKLRGQATGDLDVEAYAREVLKEMRSVQGE
ncbi:MAG: hypothetical protein ACE5FO_12220 [Parvularculaceae bacterium]